MSYHVSYSRYSSSSRPSSCKANIFFFILLVVVVPMVLHVLLHTFYALYGFRQCLQNSESVLKTKTVTKVQYREYCFQSLAAPAVCVYCRCTAVLAQGDVSDNNMCSHYCNLFDDGVDGTVNKRTLRNIQENWGVIKQIFEFFLGILKMLFGK